MILEAGVNYTVQVIGTFSLWAGTMWDSYILKLAGDTAAPENYMGLDTEYCFAVPLGDSGEGMDPTGATWFYFAKETINDSVQWFDPVPMEEGYNPAHAYTYKVTGAGEPLQITLFDAVDWNVGNNIGSLLHIIITADGENPGGSGIDPVIDIKPTSCPNPINMKSPGVIPVAILGTADFDVNDVILSSVCLVDVHIKTKKNGELMASYEDVATPYTGGWSDPLNENDCTTDGPDGKLDLTLKFDKQAVVAAINGSLEDGEELVDGEPILLKLTGT